MIKLFEEYSLPQIVVTLATSAISIADEDDQNVVRNNFYILANLNVAYYTPEAVIVIRKCLDGSV